MADRLTQLQDCLDQVTVPPSPIPPSSASLLQPPVLPHKLTHPELATQFYASLRYITTHHPSAPLPGHPAPRPISPTLPNATANSTQPPDPTADRNDAPPPPASPTHRPLTPPAFSAAVRELAHDLVLKQQQIEVVINSLPGIETSEVEQVARITELDGEVRAMERERKAVVAMKEELLGRVEGVIGRVSVGRG